MKLAGILFLFCFISSIGFEIGSGYISLIKDIERVELFLKNIILCLENENMTVGEIFENCYASGDEKTKLFIISVQNNNFEKASKSAFECGFCNNIEVFPILDEVFAVLGKYSAAEQIRELGFCRNKLKNIHHENKKTLCSKARLSRYSGVLAGAFISILLA